jgi:hypothetical protein
LQNGAEFYLRSDGAASRAPLSSVRYDEPTGTNMSQHRRLFRTIVVETAFVVILTVSVFLLALAAG